MQIIKTEYLVIIIIITLFLLDTKETEKIKWETENRKNSFFGIQWKTS